jgi:hypothetical protein
MAALVRPAPEGVRYLQLYLSVFAGPLCN